MSANEGRPINAFIADAQGSDEGGKDAAVLSKAIGWDEYVALDAMNGSTLAHGKRSMRHLKHAIDSGFEPTPPMMLGTATHALLLEPEAFESRFVVMPPFHEDAENMRAAKNKSETDEDRRTTSKATRYYKTKAAEFYRDAEHDGLDVVTQDQYNLALAMIKSIRSKRSAELWLSDSASRFEVTVFGQIEGVRMKGRLDVLHPSAIVDIKTAADCRPMPFGKSAWNLHYPMKQAIHRELTRQMVGFNPDVYYVPVESSAPHDVNVQEVPEAVLDQELEEARRLLRDYKDCLHFGTWPGCDKGKDSIDFYTPDYCMKDSHSIEGWE